MNFSASCGDVREEFIDNSKGKIPFVHPIFLPACVEVSGAFKSIFQTEFSKKQLLKHTFVHHRCDIVFHKHLRVGDNVRTTISLDTFEPSNRGTKTSTSFLHTDLSSGEVIAVGRFDGVLLGLNAITKEKSPTILKVFRVSATHEINIPPESAHLWDACIRNPRRTRSLAADINVHTNLQLALEASLPSRTLNGLHLLALVVSKLMNQERKPQNIQRISCTFAAPVYLAYTLQVLILECQDEEKHTIHFQVKDKAERYVIKQGLLQFKSESCL